MRVAVTGSKGAIGRQVVRELVAAGHEVLSLDLRNESRPATNGVTAEAVDICDTASLARSFSRHGSEAVVHLAAALPVAANTKAQTAVNINVLGALSVVEAAAEAGVGGLVHFSSKAVYGRPGPPYSFPEYAPIPEAHPKNPIDNYGISKLAGESLVAIRAAEEQLPLAILRLGSTFGLGKGDRHGAVGWLSRIVAASIEGRRTEACFPEGAATDLIYNSEVALAAVYAVDFVAAQNPSVAETFNVATGEATLLREICAFVDRATGTDSIQVCEAKPSDDGLTPHQLIIPATGAVLDTSRAKKILNFRPRISVEEAVGHFVAESASNETSPFA